MFVAGYVPSKYVMARHGDGHPRSCYILLLISKQGNVCATLTAQVADFLIAYDRTIRGEWGMDLRHGSFVPAFLPL